MKKKTKLKVNSGNTFHFGSQAYKSRHCAKYQNVLVKVIRNLRTSNNRTEKTKTILSAAEKYVADGGIHDGSDPPRWEVFWRRSVEYSMNKRKRWLLPAIIKAAVDQIKADHAEEESSYNPFNISLAERNLSRHGAEGNYEIRHSCVSYHTSALPKTHVFPRKRFAYEGDLKDKAKCNEKEKYEKSKRAQKARKRKSGHNKHFRGLQRLHKTRHRKTSSNVEDNPAVPAWVFNAHRPENGWINGVQGNQQHNQRIPEVHYEVCYPHKNFIAHKAYCFGGYGMAGQYIYNGIKSKNKCKSRMSENIEDKANTIKDGLDFHFGMKNSKEDYQDVKSPNDDEDSTYSRPRTPLSFVDVFDDCRKIKKCSSPKKERKPNKVVFPSNTASICVSPKRYGKGDAIYCDEISKSDDIEKEPPDDASEEFELVSKPDVRNAEVNLVPAYSCPSPILLSVLREEISATSLHKAFGDSYMECHTLPRGFILDPSDEMIKSLIDIQDKNKTQYKKTDNLFYLIFEESKIRTESPSDGKLFWVYVEGDFEDVQKVQCEFKSKLKELRDDWPLSIKCIINAISSCIMEIPELFQSVKKADLPEIKKTQNSWKLVKDLQGWDSATYSTDEAYKLLKLDDVQEQIQVPDQRNPPEPQMSSRQSFLRSLSHFEPMDYCDICYDSLISTCPIEDSEMESLDLEGIALSGCQHWYCKSCWRRHLLERINFGDVHIKCPGYKCDELIDPAMIIMLLPPTYYKKYLSHIGDSHLEKSRIWKWCPRRKCGRVAKITKLRRNLSKGGPSDPLVDVSCLCGEMWCFGCQKEAHWPLTCAQGSLYYKLVKQRGTHEKHQAGLIYIVQVKKCPNCRYPIEKDGGCQHMVCHKCSTDFCWECLGLWEDHGMDLICPKGTMNTTAIELDDEVDVRLDKFYTNKALDTHAKRKEVTIRIKRLQRESKATFPHADSNSSDDGDDVGDSGDLSLSDSLKSAWSFMLEGLYVQEHVYVLLSNCPKKTRHKALVSEADRFRFILDVLQKMLIGGSTSSKDFEQRLSRCVHEGRLCAGCLMHNVNKAQRKLKSSQRKPNKDTTTST